MIGWIVLFAVLGAVGGRNAAPDGYLGLFVGGVVGGVAGYVIGKVMKAASEHTDD
jgi:hypothetical protein